jgi:hypothetical protein
MLMPATRCMRIVTGPMPVASSDLTARMLGRREALAALVGYQDGDPIRGVRYLMSTASVYWEGSSKRVLVAVDTDVLPYDWAQVMDILKMTGWCIGKPDYDDIGEPLHDTANEVWMWDLTCP